MITHLYNNSVSKVPNANLPHKCLPLIRLESITRTGENIYYPNTILEECYYEIKEIKKTRRITKNFEKSAFNESDNEPYTSSDDGSDNDDVYSTKSENNVSNESQKPFKKYKKSIKKSKSSVIYESKNCISIIIKA